MGHFIGFSIVNLFSIHGVCSFPLNDIAWIPSLQNPEFHIFGTMSWVVTVVDADARFAALSLKRN